MVSIRAGYRPLVTTVNPTAAADESSMAAKRLQRVVWDPLSWLQADATTHQADFGKRLASVGHIVNALAPSPPADTNGSWMVWRANLRKFLASLLVVAAEIETDVTEFHTWLTRPAALRDATALFEPTLSPEALDHWHRTYTCAYAEEVRITDSLAATAVDTVSPVLAAIETHYNFGHPPLLPTMPTPVAVDQSDCPASVDAAYLDTARRHLQLAGVPTRNLRRR